MTDMKKKDLLLLVSLLMLPFWLASQVSFRSAPEMGRHSERALENVSVAASDIYDAGEINLIQFTLTFSSPDFEYADGLEMTFPEGVIPLEEGTTSLGGVNLNVPVVGQTISWGDFDEPSGFGDLTPGSYNFTVALDITPGISGDIIFDYTLYGDHWGSPPHIVSGTGIIPEELEEAPVFIVPFTENFDDIPVGLMPEWWSRETNGIAWRVATNVGANSPPNSIATYYNATNPKNDWFFTPGIELTEGVSYDLSFYVRAPGWAGVGESLAVKWGDGPSSGQMTGGTLYENTDMQFATFTNVKVSFVAPSSGVFFFGWHAFSIADLDFIAIDDIDIRETPEIDLALSQLFQSSGLPFPKADFLNVFNGSKVTETQVTASSRGQKSSQINNTEHFFGSQINQREINLSEVEITAVIENVAEIAADYMLNWDVDGIDQTPVAGSEVLPGESDTKIFTYLPLERGTFLVNGFVDAENDGNLLNNSRRFRMRVYPDIYDRTIYDRSDNIVDTWVGFGGTGSTPMKAAVRFTTEEFIKPIGVDFILRTETVTSGTFVVEIRAAGASEAAPGPVIFTQEYTKTAYFSAEGAYVHFAFNESEVPTIASGSDYWITVLSPVGIPFPGAAHNDGFTPDRSYFYVPSTDTWNPLILSDVERSWIMRSVHVEGDIPTEPIFSINPDPESGEFDFGEVFIGEQSVSNFTLQNAGIGTISINRLLLSSGDLSSFSLMNIPDDEIQLESGETYQFSAVFAPQTAGLKEANLFIQYDFGGKSREEDYNLTLLGTGITRPVGSTCDNPFVLELPVENFQDNTEVYGNDYQGDWVNPSTNYLNGHDFVGQFILNEPGFLSGSISGSWTGVTIVQDCPNPDNPVEILAQGVGSAGGSFTAVFLEAGTYFAIVSTWPAPVFTDFTLNLSFEPLPECPEPSNLAATNVTATTAELGWTEIGNATSWNVEWGFAGFELGTGNLEEGVDKPFLLTELEQGTTYSFYVQSICGAETSEWVGPVTFTTQFVTSVPWFEGFTTTTPPSGWTTTGWSIGTTAAIPAIDGNYLRRNLYGTGANATGMFTTIAIGPVEENMVLTFDYALANWSSPYAPPAAESGDFVVSISKDIGVTYTELETIVNNEVAGWQAYLLDLEEFVGEIIIVRIVANRYSGDYWLAFDNFRVGIPPTCLMPTALIAANITATSAELGWTEVGDATSWNIEWGLSGFEPGTGNLEEGVDNPYLLTGLVSGTTYSFYVQSVCDEETSEWVGPVSFATQLVAPVPWFEGFATTALPQGWIAPGWSIGTTAAIAPIDGNYIRRNMYSFVSTATLETINIGPVEEDMVLTFDYALANFSSPNNPPAPESGDFVVSVSIDFGSTYVERETVVNDGAEGWQTFSLDLDEFVGENIKIRIVANWVSGDYWIAFDNFRVGTPVTCMMPVALTADNITTLSAELDWTETGDATLWNIEWGFSGFALGSGNLEQSVTKPYLLTGLEQGTTYDFYVQAICDEETSDWAGPASFTTISVEPLPWFEGFATTTLPQGWTAIPFWTIGTTTAIPPIDGNYIRRNLWSNATSGTITTVNVGTVEDNMVLTFDYALANFSSPYPPPAAESGDFVVSVSTDLGSTYLEQETVVNDGAEGWQTFLLDLDEFVGENIKIRIVANRVSGDYWIAFDNFFVGTPAPEGLTLDIKVILEGAYSPDKSELMQTLINDILPLEQPFAPELPYFGNNDPVWYYEGDESVTEMPDNVVDWVLIELRDAAASSEAYTNTVVARMAALLLNTGEIVSTDLSLPVFDVEITEGLYVVIYHRNHLAVMSADALTEADGIYSWDFTQGMGKAYRLQSRSSYGEGHKELGDGVFGMYGGDGDANGQVNVQDKNNIWNPESGSSGYNPADFDLNGQVNVQDKNNIWNTNTGNGSAVPGDAK